MATSRPIVPVLLSCLACAAPAQETVPRAPQTFEVASVKPVEKLRGRLWDFSSSGPRVRYIGYAAVDLITEAYNLKPYQVAFAPDVRPPSGGVYGTAYYDIEAKAEGDGARSRADFRSMLQALLADRFQLKAHRAMKEMPVYALVVAKNGPTFKQSSPDAVDSARIGVNGQNQTLTASRKSVEEFGEILHSVFFLEHPVVDRTGLTGTYDFNIEATPQSRLTAEDPDLKNISVFTAVQQQLGLKLESHKAMIEILVVDRSEKPTAN
jgi:uncharacterized protein (TIGR03435 family)